MLPRYRALNVQLEWNINNTQKELLCRRSDAKEVNQQIMAAKNKIAVSHVYKGFLAPIVFLAQNYRHRKHYRLNIAANSMLTFP